MKTYRCAHCGYRSPCARFFRLQPVGRGKAWYCAACQPPTREGKDGLVGGLNVLVLALVTIPTGLVALNDQVPMAQLLLIYGFYCLFALPSHLLHEAGHVLAAWLAGAFPYAVRWGEGELVRVCQVGLTRLELTGGPYRGMSTFVFWPPGAPARPAKALVYLGGAIVNLLAGLAIVGAMYLLAPALETHVLAACALTGLLLQQLWGVAQLWPRMVRSGTVASDGMLLLRLLWRRQSPLFHPPEEEPAVDYHAHTKVHALTRAQRFDECLPLVRRLASDFPEDGAAYGLLLNALAKTKGHRAVVDEVGASRPGLFTEEQPDRAWAFAAINLAWSALLTEDARLLSDADRVSEMAWRQHSEVPAARMTRGAVLTALGNTGAGAAMMSEGLPGVEALADKAEAAPWLARALAAEGDAEMAGQYAALAAHLAVRARTP